MKKLAYQKNNKGFVLVAAIGVAAILFLMVMAFYSYTKVNFDHTSRVYEQTRLDLSLNNALLYFTEQIKIGDLKTHKIDFDENKCSVEGYIIAAKGDEEIYTKHLIKYVPGDYYIKMVASYTSPTKRTTEKRASFIINVGNIGVVPRFKQFYY